ncbi:hypothetical protein ACQPXB_21680 [Amycolatopsis sp. CA-161197]|uniref:hypothetical protein n=1 Tax=Amycolatopsis sp. CA-161197 TaxID=3239922 RepID=UPI003D8C2E7B
MLRSENVAATDLGWDQAKNTTVAWGQAVRRMWLLITQPGVTAVDEHPLPRTIRRRAEREGYNPHAVRVVRFRDRADAPQRGHHTERGYRVRPPVEPRARHNLEGARFRDALAAVRREHRLADTGQIGIDRRSGHDCCGVVLEH